MRLAVENCVPTRKPGAAWWRGHSTVLGVRSPRFQATDQLPGPQVLTADAGEWPDPSHQLPLASLAQIPETGHHCLLDKPRALHFPRIQEGDSGLYSCRAENQAGTAQRDFDLLVLSEGGLSPYPFVGAGEEGDFACWESGTQRGPRQTSSLSSQSSQDRH